MYIACIFPFDLDRTKSSNSLSGDGQLTKDKLCIECGQSGKHVTQSLMIPSGSVII